MKQLKIVFFLLFLILCSCVDTLEDLGSSIKALTYTGDNEIGKLLLAKLQQQEINDNVFHLLEQTEVLFDYTTLSSMESYGLCFVVPLGNGKSKNIDSYLIFKITNNQDSVEIDFNENRLNEVIVVDSDFLNNLDDSEKYLYYSRFLQYRNQGLQVLDDLCDFAEKWNENTLYTTSRGDSSIQPLDVRIEFRIRIWFDIDYLPPPAGITSWALSRQTLSYIFFDRAKDFICSKYPAIKSFGGTFSNIQSIDLFVEGYEFIDIRRIMWDYMQEVVFIMREYSSFNYLSWGLRIEGPLNHSTLGNGGSIPPPREGGGGNPGGTTEPAEPCSDEKCPYCLGCISSTSHDCRPCDCFGVEIVLGTNQTSLLNNYTIAAIPKTPPGGFFPVFYIFEMAEANSGAWFTIYQGMAPTYTRIAVHPGKWDMRACARVDGRVVTSEVLQIEKLYPSYDDIVRNSIVQSKMTSLWNQTLANTTVNTRREFGCFIYVDSQNKTYKFEDFVGKDAGPNETATIPVPYPSLESDMSHLVGFFHTHTACTYRTVGKNVGASMEDIAATQSLNVVGIVYDYIGVPNPYGTGMIIMPGHNLNDPATYSHFGVYRRPLN